MAEPATHSLDVERAHQDAWYARAIAERFFEREGLRRLVRWNLAHLLRAVPFVRSMRVVSVGCGLGDYELALAPRVGRLTAFDLSERAIAEARRRASEVGIANVEFLSGDAAAMPFAEASVDVVYALGVLHHLGRHERRALVAQARRWLAPGGWFYARDPNARGLLRRTLGPLVARRSRVHTPTERPIDPRELKEDVEAADLTVVRIDYTDVIAGPLPWVLASRSRLLWNVVFGFDRLWLAIPGLRRYASQFAITARRTDR